MQNIINQQDYDQRFDHKKYVHEVVPDVLMGNEKVKQVKICIDLELKNKLDFLINTVTGNKSWVFHYDTRSEKTKSAVEKVVSIHE